MRVHKNLRHLRLRERLKSNYHIALSGQERYHLFQNRKRELLHT